MFSRFRHGNRNLTSSKLFNRPDESRSPFLSRCRFYAANPSSNPNPKVSRKPFVKPESKKRVPQSEPLISKKSTVDDAKPAKNIVMGHVTILKRGESLDSKWKNETQPKKKIVSGDLVVFGTERLGPDPEMDLLVSHHQRTDVYGGPRTDDYRSEMHKKYPKDPEGRVINNTTKESAIAPLKTLKEEIVTGKAKLEDIASWWF
ncbi:hypothetical protein BVC80_9017g34 [Macleaya cordata]|uniref:Uncharacterized protein n=1 Tax=Macleaya cordata TaxID=56857 RepID=A0A200QQD1_MACCD|nr:hypothetical protein BVC80_9017g34 [Macleaya cordata]